MNKIIREAAAGTLESSDALVRVAPGAGGLELELESVVLNQFGPAIRAAVLETLEAVGVADAKVCVRDRGALDCVLRARVETAARRAMEAET